MPHSKKTLNHALVWFRNDLRTLDNPALFEACRQANQVTAVFLIAEQQWRQHHVSERRKQYAYHALEALNQSLASLGIQLMVVKADYFEQAPSQLGDLARELSCDSLFFNYEYALDEVTRDRSVVEKFMGDNLQVFRSNANLIIPPGRVLTQNHQAYKVFTPFKRAWLSLYHQYDRAPLSAPEPANKAFKSKALTLPLQSTVVMPFAPTEAAADKRLFTFVKNKVADYQDTRDVPSIAGTSSLSTDLAVGLLSPRQCLHAIRLHNQGPLLNSQQGSDTWVNEIVWREFYLHVLAANPSLSKNKAMRPETENVGWRHDKNDFSAWCQGKTGFPLVDAAMQQLNQTGWMHNRLRMVTATFLTKYLLIDWRWGEQYFMENLFDGHFAANNGGWQWCASTGTDAAPYFRILQPVRQAERFDPEAIFIKRYLPELKNLTPKIINTPGHPDLLSTGYPAPIVDLAFAKQRCLDAFKNALDNK